MYSKAYLDYLLHFHGSRDYFECHEILEEHWKKDTAGERKKVWVGLIQIAVALYHHRRGNVDGAEKMLKSAMDILQHEKKAIHSLGIEWGMLMEKLDERLQAIQEGQKYESINLPIGDPLLRKQCMQLCHEKGWKWENPGPIQDEHIINKHTLRDRSEIIREREIEWNKRKGKR